MGKKNAIWCYLKKNIPGFEKSVVLPTIRPGILRTYFFFVAIKPCEESQQPCDQSQSWNEENPEQEQCPQEPAAVSEQDSWQNSE
ncbi:MAG: hypothetical protein ACYS0C_08300 [Planctomycetota bacterium]